MRQRILIVSMLVLTLLLLMPSIPAIQQKTIEYKAHNDLIEQLEDYDFKNLKEIMPLEDSIKHPFLYIFVITIYFFRYFKSVVCFLLSCEWWKISGGCFPGPGDVDILFPKLYERSIKIYELADKWKDNWMSISDELGWNW